MDNIIQFPVDKVRSKAGIKEAIDELMEKVKELLEDDNEQFNKLRAKFLEIGEKYQFACSVPIELHFPPGTTQKQIEDISLSINNAFNSLNDLIGKFTLELFAERIISEFNLYLMGRNLRNL